MEPSFRFHCSSNLQLKKKKSAFSSPRLRERHQDVLRQKLFKLKQEQGVESEPLFPIIKQEMMDEDE